jgi:hypothetical protein
MRQASTRFIAVAVSAPVRPAADKRLGPLLPWIDDRRAALNDWLAHKVRPMFEERVLPVTEDVMFKWRLLVEEGVTDVLTVVTLGLMFTPFTIKTLIALGGAAVVLVVLPWLTPRFFNRYGGCATDDRDALLSGAPRLVSSHQAVPIKGFARGEKDRRRAASAILSCWPTLRFFSSGAHVAVTRPTGHSRRVLDWLPGAAGARRRLRAVLMRSEFENITKSRCFYIRKSRP